MSFWVARDISSRKNAELQIEKLAFYDPLTGLANRRLFMDRLQVTVDKARRKKSLAISVGQMQVYSQPQVDLHHRITDAEALVHWLHSGKGFVPPVQFIPLVERSDEWAKKTGRQFFCR